MSDNTDLVLRGFFSLSETEQETFVNELKRYLKNSPVNKKIQEDLFNKSLGHIITGPYPSSCPCCKR